jgi:tetratricopeptide (TPR) repeat protein
MNLKNPSLGIALTIVCMSAIAAEPWAPTDSEMASLPPFCKIKMRSNTSSSEYKMWESTLGKDFLHTHHYCMGINFINRYYRARSQQDKRFNLNNAQGNLEYMVTHAESTYSLMPDVHLNLGVVYSMMNKPAQAITHFNKAIELNPRQPRAYGALSDYYVKSKQNAKALEIVTAGLRYNPDTKSLQRRYAELGGKLPYPEPIELVPAAEAQAAKRVEPPESTSSQANPAVNAPSASQVPVESTAEPQIGSPTNPYCRFCPD